MEHRIESSQHIHWNGENETFSKCVWNTARGKSWGNWLFISLHCIL